MESQSSDQQKDSAERTEEPTNEQTESANPEIAPPPRPTKAQSPPAENGNEKSYAKGRDWLDYTKFAAELVGLGVLVAYTIFAGAQSCTMTRTLDEVRKQTPKIAESANAAKSAGDTAAKQLELTERPWVYADIVPSSPLTFDETGANLRLRFVLKNTGHSPAFVWQQPEMYPEPSEKEPISERDRFCQQVQMLQISNPTMSNVLFPGNGPPQDFRLSLSWDEIRKAQYWFADHYPKTPRKPLAIRLTVISCIAYHPTFSTARYKTEYILNVGTQLENLNFQILISPEEKTIPLDRIRLVLNVMGGIYAN